MIYITGDTHGEQMRFAQFMWVGAALWEEDDVLIVCGDFGYVFKNDKREHKSA